MSVETKAQEELSAEAIVEPLANPPAVTPAPRLGFSLSALTSGFTALRVRNYRLYWIGQLVSVIGTWMQTTAQAWLVLQLTHSAFELGLVTAFQFLPVLLFSLVGGVITDRLPKQRILLVTNTILLIQAAAFGTLVATGAIQIWHVYILAAIQGTVTAIDQPTRQAFVPELVGRSNLVNAIALNSMLFQSGRIIGPAVAGILIAQLGIAPALLVNAASFIAVIVALLMMAHDELGSPRQVEAGGIGAKLLEGVRYAWRTPSVRMIMILIAFFGTFGYNFTVVLPLLANFVLHTGADGFGALTAFMGLGSLTAALVTAYIKQVTLRRLLIGATAFSVLLGAVALSSSFALTAFLLILLGFAAIVFTTSGNTMLQLTVPDELRGRVMSMFILLGVGSTPIGGVFIGSLSSFIGVPLTMVICAALCLTGVVVALIYRQRAAVSF